MLEIVQKASARVVLSAFRRSASRKARDNASFPDNPGKKICTQLSACGKCWCSWAVFGLCVSLAPTICLDRVASLSQSKVCHIIGAYRGRSSLSRQLRTSFAPLAISILPLNVMSMIWPHVLQMMTSLVITKQTCRSVHLKYAVTCSTPYRTLFGVNSPPDMTFVNNIQIPKRKGICECHFNNFSEQNAVA